MATTGVGFRWLDILEKEFDKACVELDTSLSELETEEPEVVFGARQKIATLGSCFAQLTHKALTIFQNSAKMEAELVDMRAELVQARAASAGSMQDCGDAAGNVPDAARARAEAAQLARENAALRETVLALHSELFGARLATKYLDKELAGRIQQLQLLGRDMRAELRDSLWAQVEAEILLQRHKTLVRVCRGLSPRPARPPASTHCDLRARPRTVRVRRSPHLGLGISVTGGREHGVPILISELEAGGPAALTGELYVGDAILAINDTDLTQACHKEAVQALQSVKGDCQLCVQFIATDDDDRLSEDNYRFPLYPYDAEPDGEGATPTAPRTPDYNHRDSDVDSGSECGAGLGAGAGAYPDYNSLNNNLAILDMDDHSIKIEARLEPVVQMKSPAGSPLPCGGGGGGAGAAGGYISVRSTSGSLSGSACNSEGCTPVHRGGGGGGGGGAARRRPDWRARGTYAPIMQPHDSDTPESPPPVDDSPPSKPPAPTTPTLPEPDPEPDLVPDRYQEIKTLITAVDSRKAGVRRDSKGFRIGSARRVTNHQLNSNHLPITANHQPVTANHQPITANHQPITANHQYITANHQSISANHQSITTNHYNITANRQPITNGVAEKHSSVDKHVPLLLPGHGDPDFGTPV